MTEGKNRIMIFGPKPDGTYVVEFRTAKGQVLAISVPRGETAGIVSKRKNSSYCSGRSRAWLKSKNPACEAVKREEEEDWGATAR
jgi:ATP-dependent DNA ligase